MVPADYNSYLIAIDCRGIGYSFYASSDCTGAFTFETLGEVYTNSMLLIFNATTPGEATIEAVAAIDFVATPGCKNVEGSANSYTLDFGECSSTGSTSTSFSSSCASNADCGSDGYCDIYNDCYSAPTCCSYGDSIEGGCPDQSGCDTTNFPSPDDVDAFCWGRNDGGDGNCNGNFVDVGCMRLPVLGLGYGCHPISALSTSTSTSTLISSGVSSFSMQLNCPLVNFEVYTSSDCSGVGQSLLLTSSYVLEAMGQCRNDTMFWYSACGSPEDQADGVYVDLNQANLLAPVFTLLVVVSVLV